MEESSAPSLLQEKKRGSAKSDVSKVLYPDIGKIANPVTTLSVVTLLVTPEKLVPRCGFGRYPSNQYFRHTEVQPHACSTNLTKAIWIIMFKSRNQVE